MTSPVLLPVRYLRCAVCGAWTTGRQWHNRDDGWGVCVSCGERAIRAYSHPVLRADPCEDPERLYGVRGIHWDIEPPLQE